MAGRLSFSIAINLLTENFKKGASSVKNSLRSMQMQFLTFAAALGVGGLGLTGFVSRLIETVRETSRVTTALKNVSGSVAQYVQNQKFMLDISKKYGLEINSLTGNFAKFTASATQAGMSMVDQKKIFESVSRANTAFGLSVDESNGVFLALSQMMGKGKISSEELRKQMGEKLPVAMQAMAKAAGTTVGGLEKLLKAGKLMSADVLPKFADALNEIIPNVNTDNIETSISRLKNTFTEFAKGTGIQDKYKSLIDNLTKAVQYAADHIKGIITQLIGVLSGVIIGKFFQWIATELAKAQRAAMYTAQKTAKAAGQAFDEATWRATSGAETMKMAWTRTAKAIKTAFFSLLPVAVFTGISWLISKYVELGNEAKRINNIFADYKKKVAESTITPEITRWSALAEIMNDANKSVERRGKATAVLAKELDVIRGKNETDLDYQNRINQALGKRIELIKNEALTGVYAQQGAEAQLRKDKLSSQLAEKQESAFDGLKKRINKKVDGNTSKKIIAEIENALDQNKGDDSKAYTEGKNILKKYKIVDDSAFNGGAALEDLTKLTKFGKALKKEITEVDKVIDDSNEHIKELTVQNLDLTLPTRPSVPESDEKAEKAAEKAAKKQKEAAQKAADLALKITNNERNTALERRSIEIENQQALLDIQEDGFSKKQTQIALDYKKELLAIDKFTQELVEKQQEAERNKWEQDGSKGVFVTKTNTIADLPAEAKKQITDKTNVATTVNSSQNEKLLKELLTQYQDYATKRKEIEKKFEADLSTLKNNRTDANAAQIDAAITELEKLKKIELSDLDFGQLKQSGDWQLMFSDLDKLSTDTLQRLSENFAKVREANKSAWTPENLKEFDEALSRLEDSILDRNPIQILKGSFNDYKTSCKDVSAAQKKLNDLQKSGKASTKELQEATENLNSAQDNRQKSLSKLNKAVNDIGSKGQEVVNAGNEIVDMLTNLGVKVPEAIQGALGGLGQVMGGLASIDITKPFSLITGAVSILSGVGNTIAGIFGGGSSELSEETFKHYARLMSTMDEVIAKQKEMLASMTGADAKKQAKEAADMIDKQLEATINLGKDYLNSGASKGVLGIGSKKSHGRALREELEGYASQFDKIGIKFSSLGGRMDGLFSLTPDQLNQIKTQIPEAWAKIDDNTKEYLQTIIDSQDELEVVKNQLNEALTGISFDSAKGALKSLLADVDKTGEDVASSFEDHMREAILNTILDGTLKQQIQDWYSGFADAMSDGTLNSDEKEKLQALYNSIFADAANMRDNAFAAAGITPTKTAETSESENTLKGAYAKASQESIDLLAGQTGGMRIAIEGMLSILKGSFIAQDAIGFQAVNSSLTAIKDASADGWQNVKEIKDSLSEFKSKTESWDKKLDSIGAIASNTKATENALKEKLKVVISGTSGL